MDSELIQFQKAGMEAILGPDSEPFETFVFDHGWNFEEKDSEKELEAKSMFNAMKKNDPNRLAIKLAYYLGPPHDLHIRERCAYLLCKLITDDGDLCTWRNLSVATQSSIKCMILDHISLNQESDFIIHQLLKTVSKLVDSLLPDNAWPELLPSLYQCVADSSSTQYLKGAACAIFATLAEDIGETTVPCVKDLHPIFLNVLNDDTLDIYLRIAATRSVINFIQCVPSSNENARYQDLLPGMMRTLTDALSNGGLEDLAHYVLALFIDLAKNEPRFLRMQLVVIVGSMLDIAEDEKLNRVTRFYVIQFLLTLVEARDRAPGMMKRLPSFISRCFTLLLNLLLDNKDDPAWHSVETLDDDKGKISNYDIYAKYLYRFSVALGGKTIAYTAKEQLSAYLVAPEWEKRHAALAALIIIDEGCSKPVMIKILEHLVNMVLSCLQDPHPRVRWAACRAIGQLSSVNSPDFQEQYHNQVVPALAAAVDDFHPRVQASAAKTLSAFYASNKPETLMPYLDGLVNRLLVLIQSGKLMVQQEALLALSSIALDVEEHFLTYYDTVMPHLKAVLRNADLKSNLIIHARAMECISNVALAVGKEKFREDSEQVMEVLILLQGLQAPAEDLLSACTGICKCLGQDFLPYMSAVMPFFIRCVQLESNMTKFTESDKVKACMTLCYYANILKEDFHPWIPQVVSLFVPLLKYYTNNRVRRYAVEAMALLLRSAKLAVEKEIAQGGTETYFKELADSIILSLVEALHEEPMTEICRAMLYVLDDCLQISGPFLNEGQLRRIVDEVKHVITESSNRKSKLKERAKSEDFDAEEDELLTEEKKLEDNILIHVGHVLGTLIKTFKAGFLPFFDELLSYLIPMWGEDITVQERCTSTYIFADLLEECPEAALKYYDVFLRFLDASNDESPAVRQNALYGLGLYAEYGASVFKPFVREAISRIDVVIMHLRAREPENEIAYNTAVSALGNICWFHRESIDSAQIIPVWLNCLPIKGEFVHDLLCSMVERLDGELIGPNYQNIPKIISVFAEVLCSEKDIATEDTKNRIINVLRRLQQTLPSVTLESALTYLLPRQEMELKSILSLEEDANI